MPPLPDLLLRTQGHTAVSRPFARGQGPLSILNHIAEGCGVLKTARLVDVHADTVSH
jgi:hypothetical protein